VRILVISNFYPPYYLGGYELACYEVTQALEKLGHNLIVLTSNYMKNQRPNEKNIYRLIEFNVDWFRNKRLPAIKVIKNEITNQARFRSLLAKYNPDIIHVWNPTSISISIPMIAIEKGIPVCFFVSEHWLAYWSGEADSWFGLWDCKNRSPLKRFFKIVGKYLLGSIGVLVSPIQMNSAHYDFASDFLRQEAMENNETVKDTRVIYHGIDIRRFSYREFPNFPPTKLIYYGRISPEKGIHIAIKAINILVHELGYKQITLDIFGQETIENYRIELSELITSFSLQDHINFQGKFRREQINEILNNYDLFIFPSIWDEPFSIALLEAMASGLAIVGTASGGSREILIDEVNCLIYDKADPNHCALQVSRLMENETLFRTLRRNGRNLVSEKYRLDEMVVKIEESLKTTHNRLELIND
jgi:glycogen synthase